MKYDDTVSRKLELSGSWSQVTDSCNGLVLLLSYSDKLLLLVNPITLQKVKIPLPSGWKLQKGCQGFGFGYDSSSDDYKVVTFEITFVHFYVFSVKKAVWKRIEAFPYNAAQSFCGTYLNGAIHWLLKTRETWPIISAFDLGDEVFREIDLPSGVPRNWVNNCYRSHPLVVFGGCLCLINDRTDIWVMKEYGRKESWTRFRVDPIIDKPLYFIGDQEIVLVTKGSDGGQRLAVYNLEKKCSKDLYVNGFLAQVCDASTFVESLVSPAFGDIERPGTPFA